MQLQNIKSHFLSTLFSRGFIHDCTDLEGLDIALKNNKRLTAYVGYDATAESLHVGHLVNIMMLRWFQKIWWNSNYFNRRWNNKSRRSII